MRIELWLSVHEMTHIPQQFPLPPSSVLLLLFLFFLLPPPMISRVSVWSRAELMLPERSSPDAALPDLWQVAWWGGGVHSQQPIEESPPGGEGESVYFTTRWREFMY